MPSVTIDNTFYDLIPLPDYESGRPLLDPKLTNTSTSGYAHQINTYPKAKRRFNLQWSQLTEGQKNTFEAWLRVIRSNTFGFVDPWSMFPLPDLSIVPKAYYCRVKSDSFETVALNEFADTGEIIYKASIVFEEI